MKKALIIIAVIFIPIAIYIGILLYVNYQLNNVPKPIDQAIKDIQKPSFTIDLFEDTTTLPTIKTRAQAEEEKTELSPSDIYASGYYEPFEYTME